MWLYHMRALQAAAYMSPLRLAHPGSLEGRTIVKERLQRLAGSLGVTRRLSTHEGASQLYSLSTQPMLGR